jgi:hypothetical protein
MVGLASIFMDDAIRGMRRLFAETQSSRFNGPWTRPPEVPDQYSRLITCSLLRGRDTSSPTAARFMKVNMFQYFDAGERWSPAQLLL